MPEISVGDRVRVNENDEGIRVGSIGVVQTIATVAGEDILTIEVTNQGRMAVNAGDVTRMRPYTRRADGSEELEGAPRLHGSWLTREPYLMVGDAAEVLGVSTTTLRRMADHRGVGTCLKGNAGCRYTVRELDTLRKLKEFMDDVELDLAGAVKVQKWLERKKADRAASAGTGDD